MGKQKTLFQKCLETDAHARFVARAEGLGRDLTEDEALDEIQYLIETLPYAGLDESKSMVAQLKKLKREACSRRKRQRERKDSD